MKVTNHVSFIQFYNKPIIVAKVIDTHHYFSCDPLLVTQKKVKRKYEISDKLRI